ncbi:CD48 antigen-like [Labeo rohita]|uniref:CD48 antigen-like n=1 Tax=Labeo rohita TaxID=84645 RepID=UPI0021E2B053|nr:CD48 antigen-like [Labeo rohita]
MTVSRSRMMFSHLCALMFILCGVFVDADEIRSVSVMEGDSVTLHTNIKVQSKDMLLWIFGPQETRIAEIYNQNIIMYDSYKTFGDSLQMDNQTGSLTIRNIRAENSGLYKLLIVSKIIRGNSYRRFSVTVYAHLPVPVITRDSFHLIIDSSSSGPSSQNCSLLCSVVNVSDVTLSWYKGNSLLSSISVSDLSISLSLEYQDKNTYSCVINNPISNQTKHLDISKLCHICSGTSVAQALGGALEDALEDVQALEGAQEEAQALEGTLEGLGKLDGTSGDEGECNPNGSIVSL